MIKVINCKTKNYKKKLNSFLDKRRINKNVNTNIVIQILKDVKKNKYKALLKYEKKFSGNNQIKIKVPEDKNWYVFSLETGAYELKVIGFAVIPLDHS